MSRTTVSLLQSHSSQWLHDTQSRLSVYWHAGATVGSELSGCWAPNEPHCHHPPFFHRKPKICLLKNNFITLTLVQLTPRSRLFFFLSLETFPEHQLYCDSPHRQPPVTKTKPSPLGWFSWPLTPCASCCFARHYSLYVSLLLFSHLVLPACSPFPFLLLHLRLFFFPLALTIIHKYIVGRRVEVSLSYHKNVMWTIYRF